MTTVCFDFGNTRLKAAVFSNEEFIEAVSLESDEPEVISDILQRYKPQRTILSSVIHHNPAIESILQSRSQFHKVSVTTRVPFTTPVSKPETIGTDRLALAAAAVHYFPGKNNLVIGLGSCITFNFINQYNQFLGGSISPGKEMRFKAMHDYTAKLPLVKSTWNFPLAGYDTTTNLQSGVVNGMICEIDGIILKYKEKYNNFNAVLTGGDSAYFATQLKNGIFADFNFLFKGLYALSELNNAG